MKQSKTAWTLSALMLLASCSAPLFAGAANPEVDALKAQVMALSDKLKVLEETAKAPSKSTADTALDSKFGPDAKVTTAKGKLEVGGLVQVWYSWIQNDRRGLFDTPGAVADTNTVFDNDSFRIRRTELRFTMDIHENVSAFVMIDPAAEAASYPQSAVHQQLKPEVSPDFFASRPQAAGQGTSTTAVFNAQTGARTPNPTLLQDALINYHGIIPHHDITVGQMLNTFNEDNFADNGSLDFVERSYIGNSVSRDLGAVLHGSWWCNGGGGAYQGAGDTGRFQYWLGVWNGTANLFGTSGTSYNRSDDNDQKDFVGTMLVRPLWDDCLGKLELGYSFRAGHHGKSGMSALDPGFVGSNTSSLGHDAWAKYYAPGALKGLWFKGEATWLHDRNPKGSSIDLASTGTQNVDAAGFPQEIEPVTTFGYWGAVGYKFADSPLICGCRNSFWKNFEVDFRYESAPNVFVSKPDNFFTSVYSTKVYTSGINYYIKGDNAKIQLNYNVVQNPYGPVGQPFHNVKNNSLVLNFQVMW